MNEIRLRSSFVRDWKRLTDDIQLFIRPFLDRLASNDASLDIKRLRGSQPLLFRLRAGDYRVKFYKASDHILLIHVKHRKDVYR